MEQTPSTLPRHGEVLDTFRITPEGVKAWRTMPGKKDNHEAATASIERTVYPGPLVARRRLAGAVRALWGL